MSDSCTVSIKKMGKFCCQPNDGELEEESTTASPFGLAPPDVFVRQSKTKFCQELSSDPKSVGTFAEYAAPFIVNVPNSKLEDQNDSTLLLLMNFSD